MLYSPLILILGSVILPKATVSNYIYLPDSHFNFKQDSFTLEYDIFYPYPRSIGLSALARSGGTNIDIKENVAYSVRKQHPRGNLPSPPIVVNLQAEGTVPQEGVYDFIPGEPQPSASDIRLDTSYEIMSPCGGDKPPETTYDEITHEESR